MVETTVGRWERFETTLHRDAAGLDPHREVQLDVSYWRPDGSEACFWGFYDGDHTWKCRFMPDQLGTWHYRAAFSDGASGQTGVFRCVPSDVPGMLSAYEPNPIWFGFKGGGACLIRSLHVGDRFFARSYPESARRRFLDWVYTQGYNTLSVASHYLNRQEPGRGADWDTPRLWPLNAAAYRQLERILDDLAQRHIMVYPFAGFFGRAGDWPTDPTEQAHYVRYTLARLGPYWNILLNVSGPEPLLRNRVVLERAEIDRLGRLIRDLDAFGHPLAVHNPTGDDAFRDADWTTYGILQGPKTTDLGELSDGLLRNHHPRKPLYAQETLWSGNQHGHPDYTDCQLRQNAYVILMSAAALNFADNGGPQREEIGNSSSGFSGSLDLSARRQWRHDIVRRVWDFFAEVPFHCMRPRQDLVSTGYCLADEGAHYLAYLPEGGKVDLSLDGKTYEAVWVNAACTSERHPAGAISGGKGLVAPRDGQDWLLSLTARTASARCSAQRQPATLGGCHCTRKDRPA